MQTPIIDTHLHLIYRDRLRYPWLADVASLNRDFSYETYAVEARRCGVTDALHMEVDVAPGDIEAETRNVAELARRPQSLLRGAISACRPEDDGFPAFLDRQLADPFVRGFRRVLHVVPDDFSEGATFRANIKRLAGAARPFDLCVRPDQIDKAIALADLAPSRPVCPRSLRRAGDQGPRRASVAREHRRDRAGGPTSRSRSRASSLTPSRRRWTIDDIRPYVEHAIESFGWDRVVWGSDWPVCTLTASLSIWVAAAQAITLGCSADERARLFSVNARRIWRLPS